MRRQQSGRRPVRGSIRAGLAAGAAGLACALAALSAAQAAAVPAGTTPLGLSQAERAKAMAALPNWTGLWMPIGTLAFDQATLDPPGATAQVPGDRIHPPYNAEWEAKYKAVLEKTLSGFFTDPLTYCLPHGMPRLMGGIPGPMEFVATPEQTWITFEWGSQIRRIYTDGRGHPPEDELFPTWTGDSVGHWEGDTLVVDTVSMRDDTPYDRTGAPHSDQVHMVERIRLVDPNTLENQMTIEDPVAFTRPWTVVRRYRKAPKDQRLIDVICLENQKNPIINGQTQVMLPNDPPGYLMGPLPTNGAPGPAAQR
jgi:hypothetical protein